MTTLAERAPREGETLCEKCGYGLSGLPDSGLCPECGSEIRQSTVADGRQLSAYEQSPSARTWLATSAAVLLSPDRFYRGLLTRTTTPRAARFAAFHRLWCSLLASLAAAFHGSLVLAASYRLPWWHVLSILAIAVAGTIPVYLAMVGVQRLASWLSSLEGAYHGMRLPVAAVRRAFEFHSAVYWPVFALAAAWTTGYRIAVATVPRATAFERHYLYTLCGIVVLGAGYFFWAYWRAMVNIRYANR